MASAERNAPTIDRRALLSLAAGSAAAAALGGLAKIARPAGAQAVTPTSGRVAHDLQEFERRCDLLRQAFAIPGMSIAVVDAQELVLARGFGVVDLAVGTPAAADTPYPVASLTKTFAAAVIMRLVEAGKLDLDEAMATYDPDYRHWCQTIKDLPEARNYNCAAERITVRHHLTHTAQGKPGTTYAYNASLFARLSAVVDAVSPCGFKRAVEEDILEPLGMRDTALGAGDPNKAAASSAAWRNPMRSTVTGRSRRLRSRGDIREILPKFREMAREAGRDPAGLEITSFALGEDLDRVERLNEMGVARVVPMFPPEKADKVLPIVDRWAKIMKEVNG